MSANIGIVKMKGRIFKLDKMPFETDERLQERTWFCAKEGTIDVATVSRSHKWVNEKYFNMKYIGDHNGSRS